MKVSRISFPDSSPDQPESAGRTYLDMVEGVLTLVTTAGASPIRSVSVTPSVAANVDITPASGLGAYIRVTNGSANTVTITEATYPVGSVFEVKNIGAGTCTITAGAGVTLAGTAALATGDAAKVVCVISGTDTSTWDILAYA